MFSSLRERFGTAGLIVAVIALIAALGGSAIAAGGNPVATTSATVFKMAKRALGLAGKANKRSIKAIKIARNAAGNAGPQGVPGLPGAPGADGQNGSNGSNGTNGKSVVLVNQEPENCPNEEGFTYEVEGSGEENEVCNGEEGSPWTAGGTLPPGETETGTFTTGSFAAPAEGEVYLSFTIPLADPLPGTNVHYNEPESTNCPGTVTEPEAASGHLCVYKGFSGGASTFGGILDPAAVNFGASVAGAVMGFSTSPGPALVTGTWAVTAAE